MCRSRLADDAALVGTFPTVARPHGHHPAPDAASKPGRRFRLWPRRR